jgi:hypothetical protein
MEWFYRFVSQNKQLFFRYSVPISSVKLDRRLFLNYELNYVLLTRTTFLRRVRVVAKKPLGFVMSVRPSV